MGQESRAKQPRPRPGAGAPGGWDEKDPGEVSMCRFLRNHWSGMDQHPCKQTRPQLSIRKDEKATYPCSHQAVCGTLEACSLH